LSAPKEESEGSNVLPRPELNPLLNPLLAENMGRWAEVYFTAAPEKREEAVLELLRELEAGIARPEGAAKSEPPTTSPNRSFPDADFSAPSFAAEGFAGNNHQPLRHCYSCGHDNPETHQFCGMCGEKLTLKNLAEDSQDDAGQADRGHESMLFQSAPHEPDDAEFARSRTERDIALSQRYAEPSVGTDDDATDELSRLRRISTGNEGVPMFGMDLEPRASRRYGIYFGVGVVVVLVLAYVAWLGKLTSRTHDVQPAPIAATEPTPAPSTTSSVESPVAGGAPTQAAAASQGVPAVHDIPEPRPRERGTVETVSDKKVPPDVQPASLGNGNEELAIAQRYLNGGTGLERNSTEAAQWLWKSVAKHNSSATLILADLYLRGDGVSKNCDQARVLLDSAARKGVEGAGERLRNLQAFGCQ
jgi:hypothetical protein